MNAPRVFALVGPTGSGKTELAIALARRFDAEIINADSRQVYRRLDIGSAKPTAEQQAAVPHHLIDVVAPDERFDASRFRTLAVAAIADIVRRDKRVLVVGGTGLYVKVLRGGLFAGPSRDPLLRAQLEQEEATHPGSLHHRLANVDPPAAARLHPHDRLRLIRALEVYTLTGQPISAWHQHHGFASDEIDVRAVAVALPRAELYQRINARCSAMVQAGLLDEVRGLYAAGFDAALPALQSPGYREIGDHVRGQSDLPTALARMAQATRQLAKRQLTWFRGDAQVIWCAPELAPLEREAATLWDAQA